MLIHLSSDSVNRNYQELFLLLKLVLALEFFKKFKVVWHMKIFLLFLKYINRSKNLHYNWFSFGHISYTQKIQILFLKSLNSHTVNFESFWNVLWSQYDIKIFLCNQRKKQSKSSNNEILTLIYLTFC